MFETRLEDASILCQKTQFIATLVSYTSYTILRLNYESFKEFFENPIIDFNFFLFHFPEILADVIENIILIIYLRKM